MQEQIKEIKEAIDQYYEKYKSVAEPTAYIEKFERREPVSAVKDRYQIHQRIKSFVRSQKENGCHEADIISRSREEQLPVYYVKKAIREIDHENELAVNNKELTLAEKRDLLLEYEVFLKMLEKEDLSSLEATKRTWKIDHIRSEIEKAMGAGFSKDELVSLAEASGIEYGMAENLVQTCVDDIEEKWFTKEEDKIMDEYAEEELEMIHQL